MIIMRRNNFFFYFFKVFKKNIIYPKVFALEAYSNRFFFSQYLLSTLNALLKEYLSYVYITCFVYASAIKFNR